MLFANSGPPLFLKYVKNIEIPVTHRRIDPKLYVNISINLIYNTFKIIQGKLLGL